MVTTKQTPLVRSLFAALGAVAVLGLLGGNSNAADPAVGSMDTGAKGFLAFDTNQDGFVDAKEAHVNPVLEQSFDAVDMNKDGRLSMEEFNKGFATK